MNLADRLFRARLNAGMTQEVATALMGGGDMKKISVWETGKRQPNIDNFLKLCKLYKVSPNNLLGWDDAKD